MRLCPESEGDDIVISGMAGRFPNSRNVAEFEYNLFNKIDMVDDKESRWKHFNSEIPRRSGKILDLEKFDAPFFGVHFKQAHTMDPQGRIVLETAYESIMDAGVCPKTLQGSRTGVYVGACYSEAEKTFFYETVVSGGFGLTGCSRAMLANRISYSFDFNGPSTLVDTACSSSLYALDAAFTAFRNGEIDAAIIGGTNLVLHPYVTLQFARLGVLSPDGRCRSFDKDATGYTRSESINCIFLQRKRDAKRIYCTVLYSDTNCDGYKTEGITFPSSRMQEKLLSDFYANVPVHVDELGYIEAHSTGTLVGDPEECRALDNVICTKRQKPLLVGSVKSNVGHAEAASGLNAIIKVCLAIHNNKIPPNIHFVTPRPTIPALVEGRMLVVTEAQELKSPYIGINSFGFGGANAHLLVKGHIKEKVNFGIPTDPLPRLVNFAGRTEECVGEVFDSIIKRPLDAEYVGLLHNTQTEAIQGLVYRGYGLFAHEDGKNAQCLVKDVQHFTGARRPIVFVFSGMGSQWPEMGSSLMNLPIFRESIERCHKALLPKGLDLINILTSPDPKIFDNILHSFVGIAACQIALVDVLRGLDIDADYYIGHSVGELACGYADGCFTPEQMILSSYSRGIVSVKAEKIKGSMAAVGLGFKEIIKILPATLEVACHNSQDSSTISGPADDVAKFVKELKAKGVFAKEVACSNIAYHSRYIAQMGPALLQRLNEIITHPKKRSKKWLSTSVPKARWDAAESQYCSAEYHTNNLLRSVLFEETAALLPPDALTIEIAPHGLLQAILKRSMSEGIHVGLTQRGNKNNMNFFLSALGKLFINGVTMKTEQLYPPVEFPVSRGTPMISSLMKWDHSEDWHVSKFENIKSDQTGEKLYHIGIKTDSGEFLEGHTIDGKVLVPATAYLLYVWETLCLMKYGPSFINMPVEFEDVRFIRATPLSREEIVTLVVMIHYGTGKFEISENRDVVVTGTVREIEYELPTELPPASPSDSPILDTKDFYKELRLRGYHYSGAFRSILQARGDGDWAKIKWDYNWVTFMDCILQSHLIGQDTRSLFLPTGIRKMRINGKYHYELLTKMDAENLAFEVRKSKELDMVVCGGVEIIGMKANSVARRRPPGIPVLESYQFIPHFPSPQLEEADAIRCCVQLMLENDNLTKIKVVEHDSTECADQIISHFIDAFDDLPLITGTYSFLSTQDIKLPQVQVDNSKLSGQQNCNIIIAKNVLHDDKYVEQVQQSLAENGFFLAREKSGLKIDDIQAPSGFHTFGVFPTEKETLIFMMRLKKKFFGKPMTVVVSEKDDQFQWIEKVKACQAEGAVLVVAQNEKFNGILGFVNCLRKEPEGHLITCMLINDPKAPPFDQDHPFYKKQLKMAMAINIFKDGKWGTYRHLQLKQNIPEKPHSGYVEANIKTIGDLSSLGWFEKQPSPKKADCIYAALNFRDIMLATGRLAIESWAGGNRKELSNILGFEYVGVKTDGKRIMSMIPTGAFALYDGERTSVVEIEIPNNMSMRDAATILVAYLTVYYAFFRKVDIRKGKSILIHSGTGGVGLAAIRVALEYGLEVFTTCSTNEKKQYLLSNFPKLKESHIGYSRDTSFEKMVMLQTKGKGVDFVLNSLSGDKLIASIRCLAFQGHFLEISKFDFANNSKMDLGSFSKELTFHAVMADNFYYMTEEEKKVITDMISRDMERGIIKPLPSTVFKANEVEKAFRFLASGRHIGKVLLQIREDEKSKCSLPIKVIPTLFFDNNLVYIIPGGLGGFGLELADWLILRGALKIVLSSSRGITKSYQKFKLHLWATSYKANVLVNTTDITTREGCENLLRDASKMGQIGGIFNLAVKLQDSVFQNQTVGKFKESFGPKAMATKYLDELSRKMCPNLAYFVVFSSVSCGRGNAGQTNYGMANSIMERIIEDRVANGLPGKAIQWGAVGEVGLVADMAEEKIDMEIGGTLQQRISSCLQELDPLLSCPDPIVSSMVVAEKRSNTRVAENIIEAVMNIIGIRDLKSVSMGTTLAEMGMDSLMASEIKTTLEREYELSINPQDLRTLTFEKLKEYSDAHQKESIETVKLSLQANTNVVGMNLLIRNLGDEENSEKIILQLATKNNETIGNPIIVLPGLEGVAGQAWYEVFKKLNSKALFLQFNHTAHITSLKEAAEVILEDIIKVINTRDPFYIVSYSFSTFLTIEVVKRLEKAGYRGQLLFIDGAPHFLKKLCGQYFEENPTDDDILNSIFIGIATRVFPDESVDNLLALFSPLEGWDKKFDKFAEYAVTQNRYSKDYSIKMIKSMFNRIKMAMTYDLESIEQINTNITLVRSSQVSIVDIEEDYELSKITNGKVALKFIEGDHMTMLDNPKLAQIINETHPAITQDKEFMNVIKNM